MYWLGALGSRYHKSKGFAGWVECFAARSWFSRFGESPVHVLCSNDGLYRLGRAGSRGGVRHLPLFLGRYPHLGAGGTVRSGLVVSRVRSVGRQDRGDLAIHSVLGSSVKRGILLLRLLLRLLCGIDPRLHYVAVVLYPGSSTQERVALYVNRFFETIDLFLGEC